MRADVVIYNLLKDTSNIFPFVIPQATAITDGNVYMTYSVVETDSVTTKTSFNDYDRTTIQLSFFSASLNSAMDKADAVRVLIDRYSAILTVATVEYDVDLISFVSQDFVGYDEDNEVYMIAADYQIALAPVYIFQQVVPCGTTSSATLGKTIKVEDFPLLWVQGGSGGYYDVYKGATFLIAGSGCIYGGGASDYASVTSLNLIGLSLTTNFSDKFFFSFTNIESIDLGDNSIELINVSSLPKLKEFKFGRNNITSNLSLLQNPLLEVLVGQSSGISSLDISAANVITDLNLRDNSITSLTSFNSALIIDLTNNSLTSFTSSSNLMSILRVGNNNINSLSIDFSSIVDLRTQNNQLTNLQNSTILENLNTAENSNGFFQSSIFAGGELTAAGLAAKLSLQEKDWNVVGL